MWYSIIACVYCVMSFVTFIAFWRDKRAAARHAWRTPESTLHLLELLGGWPGALLGQRLLQHKSSKATYRFALWCIIMVHGLTWIAWLWWRTQRA